MGSGTKFSWKFSGQCCNPPSCDYFSRHGTSNFGTGDLIWRIVAKLATVKNRFVLWHIETEMVITSTEI